MNEAHAILADLAATTADPTRAQAARDLVAQIEAMQKTQKGPVKKKKP